MAEEGTGEACARGQRQDAHVLPPAHPSVGRWGSSSSTKAWASSSRSSTAPATSSADAGSCTKSLAARPGERILDVGCGPGFYVAELLEAVGPQGSVVGVDVSAPMLAIAAHRTNTCKNVAFHEADATSLPVESGGFDAALSVQVLEYVPDLPTALAEIRRSLRPGGRVVLWDVDWSTMSWHSNEAERMERALKAWDAHLAHRALPRTLGAELRKAGFEDVHAEPHTFASAELDPETYGAARLPLIADYLTGRDDFGQEDAAAWATVLPPCDRRGNSTPTTGVSTASRRARACR